MADHRDPKVQRRRQLSAVFGPFFAVLFLVPLLPFLMLLGALRYTWRFGLYLFIWCTKGEWVLFVYSDSPKWKEHIEVQILPKLPAGATVLNRSHRASWGGSLPTLAFRHFGGEVHYCPLGLIFRIGRPAKRFRFFEPFQELKHGNSAALDNLQSAFFKELHVL